MAIKDLLITEFTPRSGATESITDAWSAIPKFSGIAQRALFEALDGSTLLELTALTSVEQIGGLTQNWRQLWSQFGADLASDFRRQLLTFVEAPKDVAGPLPTSPYLQLRHVEVPPGRFTEYRAWRERTIFDVVRNSPEVEQFLAYHSVLSTDPGVMFLAGFSVDPDVYSAVFSSPHYQQIVQEAGDNFITGGDRGLYTKLYHRVGSTQGEAQ